VANVLSVEEDVTVRSRPLSASHSSSDADKLQKLPATQTASPATNRPTVAPTVDTTSCDKVW